MGEGNLLEVNSSGQVYWSQRLRATMNCEMNFHRLPWDEHECTLEVGSYSQTALEIDLRWEGLALENLEKQKNQEWEIGEQTQSRSLFTGPQGQYWFITVRFPLKRIPHHLEVRAQGYGCTYLSACVYKPVRAHL